MTNWDKTNDTTTDWNQRSYPVDDLLTEDSEGITTEDSEVITMEGIKIDWEELNDKDTGWGFFGGLIRLVTEGLREELMSEGNLDYLVYSHGEDVEIWTDTADITTVYTKINDL